MTYARTRINGEIIDWCRRLSFLPRGEKSFRIIYGESLEDLFHANVTQQDDFSKITAKLNAQDQSVLSMRFEDEKSFLEIGKIHRSEEHTSELQSH